MYIVSMAGIVLASFDKWDVRSVAKAERWISEHGFVIWKCEVSVMGTYIVTVKSVYENVLKCKLASVYGKMAREDEE